MQCYSRKQSGHYRAMVRSVLALLASQSQQCYREEKNYRRLANKLVA